MKTFLKFPARVAKIRLIQLYLWLVANRCKREISALDNAVLNGDMCSGERDSYRQQALQLLDKTTASRDEIDRELMYLRSL